MSLLEGITREAGRRDPSHLGPWREPGQAVDAAYRLGGVLRYAPEKHEILGRNGPYFNNRPLYNDPSLESAVLAGDRPFIRLITRPYVHGAFALAIARAGQGLWLHEFSDVEARYRCGRMTWRCSDPRLSGVSASLTVVPMDGAAGFAVRFSAEGMREGDKLIWTFSGAQRDEDPRWNWDPVMRGNPDICRSGDPRRPLLRHGLMPEMCRGNVVSINGQVCQLTASAEAAQFAVGGSDRVGSLHVADATALADPLTLLDSKPELAPVICGFFELSAGHAETFWAFEAVTTDSVTGRQSNDPAKAFAAGLAHVEASEISCIETPDRHLDAAVTAVCHAVDGNCERGPYIFRHGCMAFNCRFIGWRVIGGASALGWHERVQGSAAYYFSLIKQTDEKRLTAVADEKMLRCHDGLDSRFYGRGTIAREGFAIYNVQSQFFDQTINEWRWSSDETLEKELRPALELHLEWLRECFDPDDDGLYESYINTLPTDSVWYGGGGGAEETAYAFSGHRAARDLARRAGDTTAADRHQARMEKLQRAMRELLWVKERGHFGLYREQGGHQRVHADTWVYSVFLPIDAGMTTTLEAWQSLYFTEWALERIRLPFGGVLCQPSNWVPWKWSVRDMFGGDIFHLALACFQSGWGDEGYELLQGATLESAFASAVPGGFSHIGAATDFGDNSHMFGRAVVEGLFGFAPDYPNGNVCIRPAFPSSWPSASIKTPDFSLAYQQADEMDCYQLVLTKPAAVHFRLIVCAEKISRVTVNGREVPWSVAPGYGATWLNIQVARVEIAEVVVLLVGRLARSKPVWIEGRVGEEAILKVDCGAVVALLDLHEVVQGIRIGSSMIGGEFANKPGHHLILAESRCGELPRYQAYKVHLTDPPAEEARAARTPREASPSAVWSCLDLTAHYNGDVRAIFKQQYLSPRPPTCSVRLGVDGYSAWTFPYWNLRPPDIDLSNLDKLIDAQGRITTTQNAFFTRFAYDRNIAFTSLWDNWPTTVTVPILQTAKTIWMLVCGSTFPMQTGIANAVLHFRYVDGECESLELVPPFNFWMLSPWGGCDYSYEHDGFCLPRLPPPQVQLGNNCRAMVLSWKLRPGVVLESVTLETLSEDVVIGLMGLSLETA